VISPVTPKGYEMPITDLETLPDTFFNQRYGSEIIEKIRNTEKYKLIRMIDWMISSDEWITFTATITFKNLVGYEASSSMKKATKYEYQKRVLNKVRKRLSRSRDLWDTVLPIDYLAIYEKEQGSFFKPIPKGNSPHHIHGLISVKREYAYRIYNFWLRELDRRLFKDLKSIPTVSTFKIEPIRLDEAKNWVNYITKGKNPETDWFV
jgi:hypothetical protein